MFQHTAARRRLEVTTSTPQRGWLFQHTAARRRLADTGVDANANLSCFNTQPPEGGWTIGQTLYAPTAVFQHTAARRRLEMYGLTGGSIRLFQHTAARRRLV